MYTRAPLKAADRVAQRYVPMEGKWFSEVETKTLDGTPEHTVVYIAKYNEAGRTMAAGGYKVIGYHGTSYHPSLERYYIRTSASVNRKLALAAANLWLQAAAKRHADKLAARQRPDFENPVKVGDIFHWSWGYDQTNADFFQVTRVSKRCVWVRKIGSEYAGRHSSVVAVKDSFTDGPEKRKLVQLHKGQPFLSMKFGWCKKWDGEPVYETPWYAGH